jgi:uncharacterized membrane protein YecN with MAPEG domain
MLDYYWFIFLITTNSAIILFLAINVSRLRIKHRISWGDGNNKDLMKAIRVHANGIEQLPIYGLLILALIFSGTSNSVLAYLSIAFTFSRLTHAYGMLYRKPILRQVGAAITYLLQGIAIVWLLTSVNA